MEILLNNLIKKKKVLAYITNENNLLVFRQPDYPDAGIQVPGGTVEKDENIDDAIKREVIEETGITDFEIIKYLGNVEKDMSEYGKNEIHERHFYWIKTNERIGQTWENIEKFNSESDEEILFSLYWTNLKENIPELVVDQGYFLENLLTHLA